MITTMLGAALNMVLDPVFIFVLHLGVAGAALATVISCIFYMCAGFPVRKKARPARPDREFSSGLVCSQTDYHFRIGPFLYERFRESASCVL